MISDTACKILVIEDDPGICKFLKTTLTASGYSVLATDTGIKAMEIINSHCPDCILLDLGLPDMDGNDIIRRVRAWTRTPIIVISARTMEEDKAIALDLGADDYLCKPFGTIELLARIRTAIRHTRTAMESDDIAVNGLYQIGALTVDFRKRRVYIDGTDTGLTPNEYKIVAFLAKHAGQVVTYKAMLRELWRPYASHDNKILRVHMANIRRKLEPDPDDPAYIFTEVGVGYRMAENE